jgi:hypothetical protein
VVHPGKAIVILAARSLVMDLAHGRSPDRFVQGKGLVKPLPLRSGSTNLCPRQNRMPFSAPQRNCSQRSPRQWLGQPLGKIPVPPYQSPTIHKPIQAGRKRNLHSKLFGLKNVETYRCLERLVDGKWWCNRCQMGSGLTNC